MHEASQSSSTDLSIIAQEKKEENTHGFECSITSCPQFGYVKKVIFQSQESKVTVLQLATIFISLLLNDAIFLFKTCVLAHYFNFIFSTFNNTPLNINFILFQALFCTLFKPVISVPVLCSSLPFITFFSTMALTPKYLSSNKIKQPSYSFPIKGYNSTESFFPYLINIIAH